MEPVSPMHQALGLAIRRRRSEIGISQEQLAVTADLDRTYVGGIERGERNVSFSNLLRLASALETSLAQLLTGAESERQWGDGRKDLPPPGQRKRR